MGTKVFETAVVLIPPEDQWEPIQAIRRAHDRHVRRWMPHISLLYPFRPAEMFDDATDALRAALSRIAPFEITLREFRHFRHGRSSFTIWLAPEPEDALKRLQAAIQTRFPDCDDVSRHGDGFTPHLSVGQAASGAAIEELSGVLRRDWQPVAFGLTRVSLIRRGAPPNDVFRVDRHVALGAAGPG